MATKKTNLKEAEVISLGCLLTLCFSDELPNSLVVFLCFCFADDCKGKRQRKILYKTQNYLNLYAADGLRTLCIAKKVTMTFSNN